MSKRLNITIALMLLIATSIFAKIDGPGAQFQIRWHVENINTSICELKLKDYNALTEAAQDYEFSLVYTNEYQGLCSLSYKTNITREHHSITITATPLTNNDTKIGYTLSLYVDDNSLFYYDETHGWKHLEEDNDGEVITVPRNQNQVIYGPIDYFAQHPTDINRKIVTAFIPIRLRIDDLQLVSEGVTYIAHIVLEIASP